MDAFKLLDFLRIHAERCHEYCVHVAADRQIREEVAAVFGGVDVLEQRYVIPGIMHDGFDSSEHFRIEPASDLFIHQHRHTVRLAGFQRRGGTGDVEIKLVRRFQHLAARTFGHQFRPRERARHRGNRHTRGLGHLANACSIHLSTPLRF